MSVPPLNLPVERGRGAVRSPRTPPYRARVLIGGGNLNIFAFLMRIELSRAIIPSAWALRCLTVAFLSGKSCLSDVGIPVC